MSLDQGSSHWNRMKQNSKGHFVFNLLCSTPPEIATEVVDFDGDEVFHADDDDSSDSEVSEGIKDETESDDEEPRDPESDKADVGDVLYLLTQADCQYAADDGDQPCDGKLSDIHSQFGSVARKDRRSQEVAKDDLGSIRRRREHRP